MANENHSDRFLQNKCKCEICKELRNEYHRKWRKEKRETDPKYFSRVMAKHAKTEKHKAWHKTWRSRRDVLDKCLKRSQELLASRRKMLGDIKLNRGCSDCGYRKHFAALDFDHVRGEKFTQVSLMGTLALERIMAEVDKCEVVCYRCHRIRTRTRVRNGESSWAKKRAANPTKAALKIARARSRGWAFLSGIKIARGCSDCGYREHSEALDFDHVRGAKEFAISQRVYYSIAKLEAEIAKCEVVCANCHRIRTFERHQERAA
jgi:predicted  nucleic acid-binding Zn-ribbon protein